MVDKKANCEEVLMDIGSLRNNHCKHVKDTQMSWEEQSSLNEILCAENCVARWLWKNGVVESYQGLNNILKWDLESVNTCPENFQWRS